MFHLKRNIFTAPFFTRSLLLMSSLSKNCSTVSSPAPIGVFVDQLESSLSSLMDSNSLLHPHIYIGNEAGDADSLVSALCFAYLQDLVKETESTYVHIPVLSIKRGELALRPEVRTLFSLAGLGQQIENSLCYYDDTTHMDGNGMLVNSMSSMPLFRTTLLDHNVLAPKLTGSIPSSSIYAIVDHHLDQMVYKEVEGSNRNIAFSNEQALVGSTCTLVGEAFEMKEKETGVQLISQDVATLLAGVILLDTMNMDPVAQKGTVRDQDMLTWLLPHCDITRDELFKLLMDAKFDPMWWKTLTPAQVLGYDYKQGVTSHGLQYGISSALLPLDAMVLNSEFDQYCAEFMSMRQLDAFAVMTLCSSPSEEKQRQLMLVASTQEKLEALETVFLDMGGDLQLSPLLMETGEGGECFKSCFMQGDVTKSRKQVMPLFHSAVSLLKQDEQYMKYQCS